MNKKELSAEDIQILFNHFNLRGLSDYAVTLVFEDFSLIIINNSYAVSWSKSKPGSRLFYILFRSIDSLFKGFLPNRNKDLFVLERMEILILVNVN